MKILYSGFDTIAFAVKGALNPKALQAIQTAKDIATKEKRCVLIESAHCKIGAIVLEKAGGGYSFLIDTGPLEQLIKFKKNLSRKEWNGFVTIRAFSLATYGWRSAVSRALENLKKLGFVSNQISMNRVDFCVDILNAQMTLSPEMFVSHARAQKKQHYMETRVPELTATGRANNLDSITIGKMPGKQVIVYDKKREAIEKRKPEWFEFWNIDKNDLAITVHRVEIRAGKDELKKYEVRSFDDFELNICDVIINITKSIRMVLVNGTDTNITRYPLHPVWKLVQNRIETLLFDHVSNVAPSKIIEIQREAKVREYTRSINGNCAGLAVCLGIEFEDIPELVTKYLREELRKAERSQSESLRKTYLKARDRMRFIT